jgi:hypothetical protein
MRLRSSPQAQGRDLWQETVDGLIRSTSFPEVCGTDRRDLEEADGKSVLRGSDRIDPKVRG